MDLNKSHSAAYGLISYQTAYLKAHFPEEFLAASMTCDVDNTDKLIRYVDDCRRIGIKILPVDINRSSLEFDVPSANTVGFSLTAIKGVGKNILETLVEEREKNGLFQPGRSCKESAFGVVGKKTMQLLTQAGALDCFKYRRRDPESSDTRFSGLQFSDYHEASKRVRGNLLIWGRRRSPASYAR